MKQPIIDKNQSYTFRDYFNLNPPIDELLLYFGYAHQVQAYTLPQSTIDKTYFASLQAQLEEHLLYVDLTSESARRELLIAPVLLSVARYLKVKVRIEYYLAVNKQLKGNLDYYLRRANNLLVVEAKNENLQRGFTQLAVEMVALDQGVEPDTPYIYGAVSIGNVWQFGILNRETKQVTQDLNLYRVPADLDDLLKILVGILG